MRLQRVWLGLLLAMALGSAPSAAPAAAQGGAYGPVSVVILPKAPGSFDIGWADPASRRYYVTDRTNASVDVVNTDTDSLVGLIKGFAGATGKSQTAGPNGLVAVPDQNQLWVADGDSTVKVVDLAAGAIVAAIPTGGTTRADELAYDAMHQLIMVTNDKEDPAYVSFISTTDRSVVGRLAFPDATDGLEQPVWDPASGLFYDAVPVTKTNPGGEIDVIDPTSMTVTGVYPLGDCTPHGLALGPGQQMLVGCNGGAQKNSIIMTTGGSVVATITQVGGSDEVWYNPGDNHYYLAANGMTVDGTKTGALAPALGVIDASTNQWMVNVPTVPNAHSVAVDPQTNHIYVPLTNVGIGVYALKAGSP